MTELSSNDAGKARRAFLFLWRQIAGAGCIAVLAACTTLPSMSFGTPQIHQRSAPSALRLFVNPGADRQVAPTRGHRCHAVRMNQDFVVTAAHCVDGLSHSALDVAAEDGLLLPVMSIFRHPNYLPGRFSAQDLTGWDVARLGVSSGQGGAAPVLRRQVTAGEILRLDWSDGTSPRSLPCPVLGQAGPIIELDCEVSPGMSGAGLYLRDGAGADRFAGLLSGRGRDANTGIAVALHAEVITDFMRLVKLPSPAPRQGVVE